MTNRELALEIAARFTDRAKFTVDTMLKNAEKIEAWLNRPLAAIDPCELLKHGSPEIKGVPPGDNK